MRIKMSIFFGLMLLSAMTMLYGAPQESNDEKIRLKIKNYAEAYNNHDSQALGNIWAEDADYVNPRTGEIVEGREAIRKQFEETFKNNPKAHVDVTIASVTFPEENLAVVTGTAKLTTQDETPKTLQFKSTFEKVGEDWLLVKVSELAQEETSSQYENLKELDWLIGDWIDEDDDTAIETHTSWDKYKNFITQTFSVKALDQLQFEGKQVIGWDPIKNEIRTWIFDSDGGFGEGSWEKQENGNWIAEVAFTFPDGRKGSAVNIYSNIEPNQYVWESTGREVDGELLPAIEPVTVKRLNASIDKELK